MGCNIDIPHVGRRGGSIRTRHYGQLEGIDPKLKNKFYRYLENKNISRVEFLEKLLRNIYQMINWEKKGLIIDKAMDGFTHASHPSMIQIENDKFLMAFLKKK